MLRLTPLLLILFITGCSQKVAPYKNGPVMSEKNIKNTFQPILEFMDYKPGMTFADVGAGSGALTVNDDDPDEQLGCLHSGYRYNGSQSI